MLHNFRSFGFYLGVALFFLVILLPTPADMTKSAQVVAAVAVLMASWWILEVVPFAVTALIPICLFPMLEVMPIGQVTSAYSHHIIFLFLAGFIFALCIERWRLHQRIALHIIKLLGFEYHKILLGFMLATAFLSMWISNTATTLMMLPIAIAVAKHIEPNKEINIKHSFSLCLFLGIAYSASIGGVATIIGTPPNAILVGILEQQKNITINFFDWMIFALPLALVFLVMAWWYLRWTLGGRIIDAQNNAEAVLLNQIAELNPMSREEKQVILVFSFVCLLWILRGLLDISLFENIKDSVIGLVGAIVLYLLPADGGAQRLMDWQTTKKLPWEILILFGGGFALASGFEHTELTQWMALKLNFLQDYNTVFIIFCITLFVIFLTEITSNTATATLLIPLMIALAEPLQITPIMLAAAVAVATSYAFMLPVATPPNAIVFSSGRVPIQSMARIGFTLNIVGSFLLVFFYQ